MANHSSQARAKLKAMAVDRAKENARQAMAQARLEAEAEGKPFSEVGIIIYDVTKNVIMTEFLTLCMFDTV